MAAKLTAVVAPNGINTLVVPRERIVPLPDFVGGQEHLPEDNPAVTIALPEEPEGRVSIGIDGRPVPPEELALLDRVVYFAVPPLQSAEVHGRVSYVVEGAVKLLTFALRRAETVDELMDSLQAQFDNMTELVESTTASVADADQRDLFFDRTQAVQTRLVDAMELIGWTPEDYDQFRARAGELEYTPSEG
jgi:hypothetical protein